MAHASKILRDSLQIFINLKRNPFSRMTQSAKKKERLRELLNESVRNWNCPFVSANCLKTANIKTIGDLVRKTESDMLKYKISAVNHL